MPRKGEASITIPEAMLDEVRQIVEEDPGLYVSATEFVRSAVRDQIYKARAGRR